MNNNLMLKVISEIAKRELSKSEIGVKVPDYIMVALKNIGKNVDDFADPKQTVPILRRLYGYGVNKDDSKIKGYVLGLVDRISDKNAELRDSSKELSEDQNYSQQGTSMSKAELRDGIKNAIELYRLLQSGQELPPWAAAYVTLSSDYLHSVNEYMVEKSTQSI